MQPDSLLILFRGCERTLICLFAGLSLLLGWNALPPISARHFSSPE
jgi:hypothetical protein